MRRAPLIAFVLSAQALGTIAAQEQPRPQPGARVRVTAPDLREVGTLAHIDADSLVVGTTRIAVQSVTKLEVSTGQKSRWLTGAGIGFLVGAAVGAVLGSTAEGASGGGFGCQAGAGCAAAGGVLLGTVGALVGAIVGSQLGKDSWQEVPLERLSIRTLPRGDGFMGITVSVRF